MHLQDLKNIAVIADSSSKLAKNAALDLCAKYHICNLTDSETTGNFDAIIVLGGDGLMLKVLHKFMYRNIPIFGMNRGSVGFLMNSYHEDLIMHRLANAMPLMLYPLEMIVETTSDETIKHVAINEVSLLRQTNQAAKLKISVDDKLQLEELVCDGILLATPAGSTAYNIAANGPILPLTSNLLAMTPICPFRPRRGRGALIPNDSEITIEILSENKRPVSASADFFEVRNARKITIKQRRDTNLRILFDRENSLHDRILKEQFWS